MLAYLNLLKAKRRLKRLEGEIRDESNNMGLPTNHETTLITIGLIAPAALYYSIPRNKRKNLEKEFEDYLHMMAYGLFSGDLEDRINDKTKTDGIETKLENLRLHFSKKAKDIARKYGVLNEFNQAEEISRNFQYEELDYSKKLKDGDYSFVKKLIYEDPTLHNLTYKRVGVLFEFGVNAAYEFFLKKTKYKNRKEDFTKWAIYIATALQEGYDDINDLEDDLNHFKPTPIILRGYEYKLITGDKSRKLNERDIEYGMLSTIPYVECQLEFASQVKLPAELKIITKKVAKEIRRCIYK